MAFSAACRPSDNTDIQTCLWAYFSGGGGWGNVWTSGRPDVRTSGRTDVCTSAHPDVRTPTSKLAVRSCWENVPQPNQAKIKIIANNRNTTTRSKKNVLFFGLDSLSYAADHPHRKDKTIAQNRRAKTNQAKRNKQAGEPRPPPDDANSSHALSQKRQDACARQGSKQLQSQWRLRI